MLSSLTTALFVFGRRVFERHEYRAVVLERRDELVEDDHAMAAADHEWMERVSDDAPFEVALEVMEIVEPVAEHRVGIHVARENDGRRAQELEMRIVVERPADRHLDEL